MRNRTAGIVGECEGCGKVRDIDPATGLCADCGDKRAFAAFVGAVRGGEGAGECERYLASFVPDEVVADMAANSEVRDAGNGSRIACWRGFRGFLPAVEKGVAATRTAQEADAVVWDGDDESQSCELPDGSQCEVFENADGEWLWELWSAFGEYVDSERGFRDMEEAKGAFERSHGVYRMAAKTAKVYCLEYTYEGDSLSDYLGHVAVEAESVEDALQKAEEEVEGGWNFRY